MSFIRFISEVDSRAALGGQDKESSEVDNLAWKRTLKLQLPLVLRSRNGELPAPVGDWTPGDKREPGEESFDPEYEDPFLFGVFLIPREYM